MTNRVLICPDKFAGTSSAPDAAAALARGWRSVAPHDELIERPLADGGPGFLEVLAAGLGSRGPRSSQAGVLAPGGIGLDSVPADTVDPLGRPVRGWLLLDPATRTAYLESAQACGLHLLAPSERDPAVTTSYGLGQLLLAATNAGARELVVGLGGSAVNDGGAGMLAALGAAPLDAAGTALPPGGRALLAVASLAGPPRLPGAGLVAATDVDNPLLGPQGASAVFGPQKGAGQAQVAELEAALTRFARVLERDLPGCPAGLADLPGAGAAGGLGAGLLALGGRRESGIGLVRRLTGFDQALAACDLVITGEGSFDQQSLRGKVVAGVARAARARGVPCLVVAGRVTVTPEQAAGAGIAGCHSLVEHFDGDVEAAMGRTAEGLAAVAAKLAAGTGW